VLESKNNERRELRGQVERLEGELMEYKGHRGSRGRDDVVQLQVGLRSRLGLRSHGCQIGSSRRPLAHDCATSVTSGSGSLLSSVRGRCRRLQPTVRPLG
jgi:hypothetical protein